MNKKVATINIPAIWMPIPNDEMIVRKYEAFPYEENKELKYSTPQKPVTRYAKNFKKGDLRFSLCMFSDEKSKTKVDSYFKSLVKELSESEVSMALVKSSGSSFTYLENKSYGDKK